MDARLSSTVHGGAVVRLEALLTRRVQGEAGPGQRRVGGPGADEPERVQAGVSVGNGRATRSDHDSDEYVERAV